MVLTDASKWAGAPHIGMAHQPPRNDRSDSGLQGVPAGTQGSSCPSPLRQQVGGCFYKPPRRSQVSPSAQTGEPSSPMGTDEPPLSERDSHAGLIKRRSRHAVAWQTAPGEWRLHPQPVNMIWRTFGHTDVDFFTTEDNSTARYTFKRKCKRRTRSGLVCALTPSLL